MLLDLKNEGLNKPNTIKLYHGSKSGIVGPIKPDSRGACDFGPGFYMGTMREQAFSLVCKERFPGRKFYEVSVNTSGLNVLRLGGMQWLFFVLCCRDEVPELRHSRLYKSVDLLREKADIVNGMIADDEMPQAVQSFLGYILTDVGVYRALSALQLGEQFAAVLEKGCDAITLTEVTVPVNEQSSLVAFDKARMRKSNELYASIFKTFKSIGRCLDDLLQEGIADVSIDKLPDSWEEIVRRYKR